MRIRDTLGGKKMPLGELGHVGIYLCGVTVYDDAHIGHARTIIIFDVLRRHLESMGVGVRLIQNFTDVDDKIIERAGREGRDPAELSSQYIQDYYKDFDRLGVKRADLYPRATEHIGEMINLIQNLVDRGMAYAAKNGVYFGVSKFPEYGKLSKNRENLQAGARIQVDEDKRDPLDFALWKFSSTAPSWPSPWGQGRPGWHIECSAMSLRYLEEGIDIHGGGRDLIFPHHENEIAQSEAHTGRQFAKIWMHVGMVTIAGEKMSKSLGNIRPVRALLDEWGPDVVRLFCIGGHYSKPVDYTEELLREHRTNWDRMRHAYYMLVQCTGVSDAGDATRKALHLKAEFRDALDDDLNTHAALDALYRLATYCMGRGGMTRSEAGVLLPVFEHMLGVLGLAIPKTSEAERERIESLIAKRNALRDAAKYDEADQIRDLLASEGIELMDGAGQTTWSKSD